MIWFKRWSEPPRRRPLPERLPGHGEAWVLMRHASEQAGDLGVFLSLHDSPESGLLAIQADTAFGNDLETPFTDATWAAWLRQTMRTGRGAVRFKSGVIEELTRANVARNREA